MTSKTIIEILITKVAKRATATEVTRKAKVDKAAPRESDAHSNELTLINICCINPRFYFNHLTHIHTSLLFIKRSIP